MCKVFLEKLLKVMKELEIDHIFAHADEQVYARLAHIIWKYPDVYDSVIVLMGGFHQLRVRQRILHKRHSCKGYKSWWVDAGTIAEGSASRAEEGGHYYRNMRLHKETFCALVQFRVEKITSNYEAIDTQLIEAFQELRLSPNPTNLDNVIENEHFTQIYLAVVKPNDGTESRMTTEYLRDVSSLLALVSAVREGNLERHLQAEREMLKHCFAFDHVNYARYMSFQHVFLRDLERKNHPAIADLKQKGFGGSVSGNKF